MDSLGDRMKSQYENRTRYYVPRRTYTVIRCDGKCFSSYTRGLDRPYDEQLMDDMLMTTQFLCREVAGCRFGYTQSDEISLVLTDFATIKTEAWFDGCVQKMASVSASLATGKFNELRPGKLAFFDSRVFTIPDLGEVLNYVTWRQKDATRNSVSMAAQAKFSHKELHGKSSNEMQEMLFQTHGVNWNDYPVGFKRGSMVYPTWVSGPVSYVDRRTGKSCVTPEVKRRVWFAEGAQLFTGGVGQEWLASKISPSEESS